MIIAYDDNDVKEYMAIITSHELENPVLIDKYLMGKEVEVDAICDGTDYLIPGIMEHVERAGVHSGDSISVYPSQTLSEAVRQTIIDYTGRLARALKVVGLVNIQYVVYQDTVYVIEVNPRSSRTVPYISKVTNVPMVELATRCMLGEALEDMGFGTGLVPERDYVAVKVPVFSFEKLRNLDVQLGPEMKSTGEVLGLAKNFEDALFKGLVAAGYKMKKSGGVLITVRDTDKVEAMAVADKFRQLGFDLYATAGTANRLNKEMIPTSSVRKMHEEHPNIVDLLESGKIDYIISTDAHGRDPKLASVQMRRIAVERAIPVFTSLDTATAMARCLAMDKTMDDMELIDITKV